MMISLYFPISQDMRSLRFAYKKEEKQPEIVDLLAKYAFPLCKGLVSDVIVTHLINEHIQSEISDIIIHTFRLRVFAQALFAFLYEEEFPVDGWKVYDPMAEYKRQVGATLPCLLFVVDVADSTVFYYYRIGRQDMIIARSAGRYTVTVSEGVVIVEIITTFLRGNAMRGRPFQEIQTQRQCSH